MGTFCVGLPFNFFCNDGQYNKKIQYPKTIPQFFNMEDPTVISTLCMKLIRALTVSFIHSFVSHELASPGISPTSTDAWSLSCITPAFRHRVQTFARGS